MKFLILSDDKKLDSQQRATIGMFVMMQSHTIATHTWGACLAPYNPQCDDTILVLHKGEGIGLGIVKADGELASVLSPVSGHNMLPLVLKHAVAAGATHVNIYDVGNMLMRYLDEGWYIIRRDKFDPAQSRLPASYGTPDVIWLSPYEDFELP